MSSSGLLVFLPLLFFVAQGAIHKYNGDAFFKSGDVWLYRGGREGLYQSSDAAIAHWSQIKKGIANGQSYIKFRDLQFHRPLEEAMDQPLTGRTGLVQALIFEVNDRDLVGAFASNGDRSFCCTPELVRRTGCTTGRVIVRPQSEDIDDQWPRVINMDFFGNSTDLEAGQSVVHITGTGMYYLWFVICDKNLAAVTVTGTTEWKNPSGYLPGMMAPLLGFYGVMTLCYLVLGVLWFVQYCRFYQEILQLQHCISSVIFLGMCEMSTWYFDFVNFNASGVRPYGTTLWAVTLGAVKKTVSRMLVLVVSMGFGVVRPTLGGLSQKVLLLGGAYFVAVDLLDIMQNVGAIDDLSNEERVFLVLPVAVLDAVFILWIFTSLSKTLSLLQAKRNTSKLELYVKFTNGLAVAVVLSVGWIIFEMYFKVIDQYNERWESDWITGAFWHVISFFLLCGICVLWAPSKNSTRYAYSEEVGDEWEEDAVPLTEKKGASATNGTAEGKAVPAAGPGGPPGAGRDKKAVNTDVFSLDDDAEEGGKLE